MPRLVVVAWRERPLARAEEAALGYAAMSVAALLSLRWLGTLAPGVLLALVASCLGLVLTRWRRPQWHAPGWSALIRCTCTAAVALPFLPQLLGLEPSYAFPDIFDLPKHVAAVLSAARAEAWPPPNPWAPGEAFLYNLCFYTAPGFLLRWSNAPGAAAAMVAVLTVWVCWLLLALLDRVVEQVGGSAADRTATALCATAVGPLTGLLWASTYPIGFRMTQWGLAPVWLSSPYFEFVYIPQHLFALALLAAAWLALDQRRGYLLAALAAAGALLSSFILAPLVGVVSGLLLWREWRRWPLVLAGALALGPIFMEVAREAGGGAAPRLHLTPGPAWSWLVSAGPAALLALLGVFALWRAGNRAGLRPSAAAVLAPLAFWLLVQFPDAPLILLCYKRRTQQKGQQGSSRRRALAILIRSVAMELVLCRSARTR